MDKLLKEDLYRYGKLTGIKGFLKGWMEPGFRYTFFMRQVAKNRKLTLSGIFYRLLKRHYSYKYGYQISIDAQIDGGLYLYHRGTVIIGPVKIGKNWNISHNIVIGRAYKNGKIGRPTIGNNVWIGPGSVITGEIKIGNNVFIAPNSVVNINIPDNSMVAGNPAKYIRKEFPNEGWIHDVLD